MEENRLSETYEFDSLLASPPRQQFTPKRWTQFVATLVGSIGAFALGNAIGWSSPALPNMEELGVIPGFKADSDIAMWIGAMTPLGATFSGLAAAFLLERVGRRYTMLMLALPMAAAWFAIAFATSENTLLAGRFFTGLCGGAYTMVLPIYVSEISVPEIRGLLLSLSSLMLVVGILFAYIVGSFVTWQTLAIICAIFPLIFFPLCLTLMVETPWFFLTTKNYQDALVSLQWLRVAPSYFDVEEEFQALRRIADSYQRSTRESWKELLSHPVLEPTAICLILMFFQQFGGVNAVIFYTVSIFKSAGTHLDANWCTVIVGGVQVIFCGVSALLVDRVGRKILLVSSALGMTASLVALGVFFYLLDTGGEASTKGLGWLPLASLVSYMVAYSLGIGPLPWTLLGELLPPAGKGITSSIVTGFCWILGFVITRFFGSLVSLLTSYGCYWFFALCSFLGFLFCIWFVPETKGRSMDDIERYFRN